MGQAKLKKEAAQQWVRAREVDKFKEAVRRAGWDGPGFPTDEILKEAFGVGSVGHCPHAEELRNLERPAVASFGLPHLFVVVSCRPCCIRAFLDLLQAGMAANVIDHTFPALIRKCADEVLELHRVQLESVMTLGEIREQQSRTPVVPRRRGR